MELNKDRYPRRNPPPSPNVWAEERHTARVRMPQKSEVAGSAAAGRNCSSATRLSRTKDLEHTRNGSGTKRHKHDNNKTDTNNKRRENNKKISRRVENICRIQTLKASCSWSKETKNKKCQFNHFLKSRQRHSAKSTEIFN